MDGTTKRFLEYAEDAGNWGGNPWVSEGNIRTGPENSGFIMHMIRRGWIHTEEYEPGSDYIVFTELGKKIAAQHGFEIS